MIYEKGNQLVNSLERRFGKLAFPQLLRWIAGFQVMTWALASFSPEFLQWIQFDQGAILSGEVWRVFSWVLVPRTSNVLFVIIAALFMFFISDALEGHWGSFRVTLYVVSSIVMITLAGLLPWAGGVVGFLNMIFYSVVFLAFASLFPNQVIHLFGIIPIKAKWLGFANATFLIVAVMGSPVFMGIILLVGMAPYLLTFIPGFIQSWRQGAELAVRRHRFEAGKISESDAFHECDSCGATDKSHPQREFRVSAEGGEYCNECRKPTPVDSDVSGE